MSLTTMVNGPFKHQHTVHTGDKLETFKAHINSGKLPQYTFLEPKYIERTQEEIEASKTKTEKLLDYYSKEFDKNTKELRDVKTEFSYLLRELSYIKKAFGKSYYRLDISKEKIENIKSIFL